MPRRGIIHCPECDSAHVRPARARGFRERFLRLFGYDFARCEPCGHRFAVMPLQGWRSLTYAKCPKCLRMDLSMWDPKYYRSSLLTSVLVWLGANRWRCEPCRTNFVSFRPRKEKYRRPGESPNGSLPRQE